MTTASSIAPPLQQQPLISVYMPTHNRAHLLTRAVESVLKQSWQQLELIIVNDASTDDTAELLAQLQQRDPRIKVLHNSESKRACASRNIAIKHAQGEFVTGLDDDDEFTPDRLSTLYNAYNDNFAFVCAGYYWNDGKRIKKIMCRNKIVTLHDQYCYTKVSNQILVKRERMLAVNGFDENFVSQQDYDCFTRLIQRFGSAKRVGVPLMHIHALESEQRISTSNKYWQGYQQFLDKHHASMKPIHIKNVQMLMAMRQKKKLKLIDIITTIPAGLVPKKLKYYLKQLVD